MSGKLREIKGSPADFSLRNGLCPHCLRFYSNTDRESETDDLCLFCRAALSISKQKKNKLLSKQLELFLNFPDKKRGGNRSPVLVAYSGGTDSTLALYLAKTKLKLDVIAFRISNVWDRAGIARAAEAFCLKYRIPLLTISVDSKALFLKRYSKVKHIPDSVITDYPWCRLCAEGGGFVWAGVGKAAELLKIPRVITGIGYYVFSRKGALGGMKYSPDIDCFVNTHSRWLSPISTLKLAPNYITLNLPITLGYTKQKKMQELFRAGHVLPDHYLLLPESDCNLGLVLPCAQKAFHKGQQIPKASAYPEFLSGYLTREEWLESLIRVNSFSESDSRAAVRFMRSSLLRHRGEGEIDLQFNHFFAEKFAHLDIEKFKAELICRLKREEHIIHAEYFFRLNKFSEAIREAQEAIRFNGSPKELCRILGFSYARSGAYEKALPYLKEAAQENPSDGKISLMLSRCYAGLGRLRHARKEEGRAFQKIIKGFK